MPSTITRDRVCPTCGHLARKAELKKCRKCKRQRCLECDNRDPKGVCVSCGGTDYPPTGELP